MKKLLCLIMALMLCLTAAGCGGEGDKDKTDKKDENVEVIRIAKAAYHTELDAWNEDDEYGEALRNMIAEIEGEENIRIQIDYYAPTEFGKLAQTAITNGDTSFADIMIMQLFTFGPIYAQGLLLDASELPGLDVSSDVWSKEFIDLATFGGKTYGVASPGLLGSGSTGAGMVYNKTLADSLGLEDPVQLARDGKWTWDKLRELSLKAAKDLNNDGKFGDDDRFGCTSTSWDALVPVFFTSGVPTMVKTDDGRLVYNLLSDEANVVAQKLHSTFTTADGMFYGAGFDAMQQNEHFAAGKAVFLLGGLMKENSEMTVEIMALPVPKYTQDSEYVTATWHNASIMTVPMIAERKELIGRVIQMLGEKSKDFQKYAINDASVGYVDRDTYVEMSSLSTKFVVDPCTIMINANEAISVGTMRAIGTYIIDNRVPFSQLTQGNATAIQSLLDEMFNPK